MKAKRTTRNPGNVIGWELCTWCGHGRSGPNLAGSGFLSWPISPASLCQPYPLHSSFHRIHHYSFSTPLLVVKSISFATMQSSVAARASSVLRSVAGAPSSIRTNCVRSFGSSSVRSQAVPSEKPVLNKEFKIYRWVCPCLPLHVLFPLFIAMAQNWHRLQCCCRIQMNPQRSRYFRVTQSIWTRLALWYELYRSISLTPRCTWPFTPFPIHATMIY